MLLNKYYPFVSFASHLSFSKIEFMEWYEQHDFGGYRYLKVEQLNEQIQWQGEQLLNSNELKKTELQEIRYWKPKTVGEIIYHYWD
ncbi:hypothetical protein [Alteribacter aurantiacus]|uniref:hypothetical protein n=1 Tax=Alteribacter aurantiacus TaxID=254410 RepID=UPI00047D996E|nr:hypothetical protein [Alteribacter aurantiacus]